MHKPATPTKRHLRTSLAAAGAALLGLSLLLTAAPALGAANHGSGGTTNGNGSNGGGGGSGNVKVHDAATGLQTSGTDNEPHVCDFWLEFDFAESHEAGAWSVVSIAPTGDGSTVASGTYDTAGDGTDASSVIVVPSGHYRVEWTATGTTTTKKTFWVDDGCRETAPPADASPAGDRAPSDDPAPPADESPAEEPASSLDDSPASDPAPPSNESVTPPDEQLPSSLEETVVDDLAPPVDETAVDDLAPPVDETAVDDLAPPMDETVGEDPTEEQGPGSTDAESPPDQDQLDGTAVGGEPTMPDTAAQERTMTTGLPAALALFLLILLADVTVRRQLQAERD